MGRSERMNLKLVVLIVFVFALIPSVSAQTATQCVNGDLYKNITEHEPAYLENIIVTVCENGCMPIGAGQYQCITNAFYVPVEVYLLFQIVAFIFFFLTLYTLHEDSGMLLFPLLGTVFFFFVSIMSFNMGGVIFMAGAALNMALGVLMIGLSIITSTKAIPQDQG